MLPATIDPSMVELVDVLGNVLLITAGTFISGMLVIGGGVWYTVRRIRRSRSIQRGIEHGGLALRAISGDAGVRHLARRRLEIARSLDATNRTLEAAQRERRPLGQLPYLAADLEAVGTSLSGRLRVAEVEPVPEARAAAAAAMDAHVQNFLRLSADLRSAGLSGTEDMGVERLRAIAGRLDIEVSAMGAWHDAYRASFGEDRDAPTESREGRP